MNKKARLRNQCDRLWYQICLKRNPNCLLCGIPANYVHHFFRKGSHAHLRYDLENGITLCKKHHFALHFSRGGQKLEAEIILKKGQKWLKNLTKKAYQRPKSSYLTIEYYEDILKKLK